MNPTPPISRNDHRQPQWMVIQGAARGVMMAPRLVPALKIPLASDLSFFGNHSATVLRLAGKTADSPSPSAERNTMKPVKDRPKACAMEARLQKAMAIA